jgi:CRISPR-associated protein (TIGR03986 family)
MIPKHIDKVPDFLPDSKGNPIPRKAVAPYNFVELPSKVVEVSEDSLPSGNRYHSNKDVELPRHTGRIECTLTTESPLYIRCGLTPADFSKFGDKSTSVTDLPEDAEERARRTDFFRSPGATVPLIPGSSLRGMLRTLVEVASFSKITPVSDHQRLFFRAVATDPKKDSLAAEYKHFVKPETVQAGYLRKDTVGWYIQPAKTNKNVTFAWIEEANIPQSVLPDNRRFNSADYEPQYIPVSYASIYEKSNDRARPKRKFATDVDNPDRHSEKGVLVTSGNMKQSDDPSPRQNHCLVFDCLVFEPSDTSKKLRIDPTAVQHYCNALTEFQKDTPFSKETGILEELENRVVFYYPPEAGKLVGFFGQSPNFRIPYSPEGNGHASTVADFIPGALRDLSVMDLADAIFGFVRQCKQDGTKTQTRAGRVFISDAKYEAAENGIWERVITPQILGSPKPTTFQHYLVQPEETGADKPKLKHYASQPPSPNSADETTPGETVIRGHKLYWHKGNVGINKIQQISRKDIEEKKTQYTEIKPIKKGVSFAFTIRFENLSVVELGALLWVLNVAQNEKYRLSLGMGKPLGMGAVRITHTLCLSDRQQRYSKLFNNNDKDWEKAENPAPEQVLTDCIQAFEIYVLDNISPDDYPNKVERAQLSHLKEIPRIEMLLAMLRWDEIPPAEQTRYMQIDRVEQPRIGKDKNEYKERPVLPTPLQIMNIPDRRRLPSLPKNTSEMERDRPSPPIKKRDDRPKNSDGGGGNPVLQRPTKPKR